MDSDTEMGEADAVSDVDSLASTVPSEEQSEYDVEEILYERDSEDGPGREFLVKWTDYELHRAEFVPRENFNARIILRNWERKKRNIAAGLEQPFDIESWQAEQERIAKETEARRQARNAKRAERAARRLALLNHPGNDGSFDDASVNENANSQIETNPAREGDLRMDAISAPNDAATVTRAALGKHLSAASEDSSSLFVSEDSSSGSKLKRRRLLGQKDTTLFGPPNPEDTLSNSDISSDSSDHQLQLQQELQLERQPRRTGPLLKPQEQPQRQGKHQQSSEQQQSDIPPRSHQQPPTSAPSSSTAPLSKPPLSGFGLTQPQVARPRRAWRREREPDINQLKLLRPSEFPAREGGADSTLFSTIRSPDEVQFPSGPRNSSSSIAPMISKEPPATSPKLPSSAGPRGSEVPQPDSGTGHPEDSSSVPKEALKASTDPVTLSPRHSRAHSEAETPMRSSGPREKPLETSRPPPKEAFTVQSPSSRPPPRALRADRDSDGARLSDRREKLPELPSTNRRSPRREPGAVETDRYDRSSDSPINRESQLSSGGDSYRPNSYRASISRRGADYRRPSPSPPPPPPESFRPKVLPRWNSYGPTVRPGSTSLRIEKEAPPARQRSPPPSNKPPQKNRASSDAEAQIARMPVGVYDSTCSLKTSEGYFWNRGEVLAHVFFGPEKKRIGPVRLCGMSEFAKNDLLGSKGSGRTFEVWFKDLCTVGEYKALCDQALDNDPCCNAWMEGFKDTNPALFHMTEELREQDLVAIYRPIKARGNVWLAYSRKSLGFSFMNWTTAKTPAGVPIYLAVRPPLPPMTALRSRERKEPIKARREFPENVRFRGDVSESRHSSLPASALEKIPTQRQKLAGPLSHGPIRQSPEAVSSTIREHAELETRKSSVTGLSVTSTMDPRLRRRPSLPAVVPAQDYIHPSRRSLVEGQADASGSYLSSPSKAGARNIGHEPRPSGGAGHEKPDAMDLTPDVQAHSTAPQRQEPVNALMPASDQTGTKILMDFFEKTLKMTVKELSSLDEGGADSSADNFYLHFPQDTQAEYQLIETWLKAHDVMVWTDWGKFIKNCKRGVVIFHESFTAYWTMRPRIREALWMSRMNFWNVRISRPLETPDERFCELGAYYHRLFARGHAYLLTEDVFSDLKRTAVILCWFYGVQKSNLGAHKLFLRPGVMEYLDQRLEDPRRNQDDDNLLLTMIYWIRKVNSVGTSFPHFVPDSLNPGQLDNTANNILSLPLPNYGSRTEADNPEIPKGLTQVERDADHLVEAFAGFTIVNAARFRKTIVITAMKNPALINRWESWGHVAVYSVNKFFDFVKLDEKALLERIQNGGSRSSQKGGTSSATQTPKTPVDPRTPKAPWDNSPADENPAQGQGQRRAPVKDRYPASYQ